MHEWNASADRRPRGVRGPRILTITSGKGGVGKSSVAVNLGITLARRGRRVCILDGDTGLANVNILLGLRPRQGLAEVLAGECRIEEILMDGPHGLKIIPGASGIREYAALSTEHQRRLVAELGRIEQDFDDLVLDTAAGIGDTTLDFIAAGHLVLLVLTPEPTSLTDSFSLLKVALRRQALDVHVIVNMVSDVAEARSVFQRFASAVEKYLHTHVSFTGFIQRDESLRAAVTLQQPVALFEETDPSARPFQRLADGLEGLPQGLLEPRLSRLWSGRLPVEETRDATAPQPQEETSPPGDSSGGGGPGNSTHSEAEAGPDAEAASARQDEAERGYAEQEEAQPQDPAAAEAPDAVENPVPDAALEELRTAFAKAMGTVGPEAVIACLRDLYEPYRGSLDLSARDVTPPWDLPGSTGAFAAADAEADRTAWAEKRGMTALEEGSEDQYPAWSGPAASGDGDPGRARSQPPDFGWQASQISPVRKADVAAPASVPAFDIQRFGSQEALAERLRELKDEAMDLAEFLQQW